MRLTAATNFSSHNYREHSHFFFLLSGFVIGYAYDDRWRRMSLGEFFRRRLIRLHPMIVVATCGALDAPPARACTNRE